MTLPTETLSSIFEYACTPPNFGGRYTFPIYTENDMVKLPEYRYFQLTLAAVCSHWRQAVLSNPHLWTWVTLDITGTNAERKAAFLRLFIENSKNLPFTLALHFPRDAEPRSYLVHQTIDNLLIGSLPRIKERHLVDPPLAQLRNYTPYLSQIRDYSVGFRPSKHSTHMGRVTLPFNAPLHRFSLQGMRWQSDIDIELPWTAITSLNLLSIAPDLSVQVFIQCPNLIEFRCRSPSHYEPPPAQVTLSEPISFQHLVKFRWETYDSPWSRALIRYLHLPALKELYWSTSPNIRSGDIQAFFNRLPPTLVDVGLKNPTSYLEYIRDDSNINSLTLWDCTTRDIRSLFQKLRLSVQEGEVVKPLPQLQYVAIGRSIWDEYLMGDAAYLDTSYSAELVDILEERLDESNKIFLFATEITTFETTEEDGERIDELVSEGYETEIIWGYEPPDDI